MIVAACAETTANKNATAGRSWNRLQTFFMAKTSPSKRTNHSFACHLREEGKMVAARKLDARTTIDEMALRVKRNYAAGTTGLFCEPRAVGLWQRVNFDESHASSAVHSLRDRGIISRCQSGEDR